MFKATCATCVRLRRFMLAFCAGGLVMWKLSHPLPADGFGQVAWRVAICAVIGLWAASVLLRVRGKKARLRRLSA